MNQLKLSLKMCSSLSTVAENKNLPISFSLNDLEMNIDQKFYICKYPITVALWYNIRNWAVKNGFKFSEKYNRNEVIENLSIDIDNEEDFLDLKLLYPKTYISWADAIVWCNAYNQMIGNKPVYFKENNEVITDYSYIGKNKVEYKYCDESFRLPTVSEWAFAFRGGDVSSIDWEYTYSGSNDISEVAWYDENSNERIQFVGQKKSNSLGLFDMSGNVWEWCWDNAPTNSYTSSNTKYSCGGSFITSDTGLKLRNTICDYSFDESDDCMGLRLVRNKSE